MIYVIADDLTGANDTGVQFAKNGYRTMFLISEDESLDITFSNDYDVFVIDTESRGMNKYTTRNWYNN